MGIVDLATQNARHKCHEYYKNGNVLSTEKIGEDLYCGTVRGSADYRVTIDLVHPRKLTCECPYTSGNTKICKHMFALYFALFPEDIENHDVRSYSNNYYFDDDYHEEIEYDPYDEELHKAVRCGLRKTNKEDLIDVIMKLLFDDEGYTDDIISEFAEGYFDY